MDYTTEERQRVRAIAEALWPTTNELVKHYKADRHEGAIGDFSTDMAEVVALIDEHGQDANLADQLWDLRRNHIVTLFRAASDSTYQGFKAAIRQLVAIMSEFPAPRHPEEPPPMFGRGPGLFPGSFGETPLP